MDINEILKSNPNKNQMSADGYEQDIAAGITKDDEDEEDDRNWYQKWRERVEKNSHYYEHDEEL